MTSPDPNKNGDRVAAVEPTFFHSGVGDVILRDTAVYCAADRYGLEELKKLSSAQAGPAERDRGRHDFAQRSVCLREHAGQRLAPTRSLPRSDYPQPENIQA